MGDVKKAVRRFPVVDLIEKGHKKFAKAVEKPFRTGATAQGRAAELSIKQQQQRESMRLAETTSEAATAAAAPKRKGRQSLIKTSPSGLSSNLGGS